MVITASKPVMVPSLRIESLERKVPNANRKSTICHEVTTALVAVGLEHVGRTGPGLVEGIHLVHYYL